MLYELSPGQTATIIDENGDPVATSAATATSSNEAHVIIVSAGTNLAVEAIAVGAAQVVVTPTGSTGVEHDVTVVPAPFDWSLQVE